MVSGRFIKEFGLNAEDSLYYTKNNVTEKWTSSA